ncbi:MAG: PASTA domain-containing protein [Candidatus Margulisiibacteriota bacterium]
MIDNFQLLRKISEDDLGVVYLAEQYSPPKKVLVKVYTLGVAPRELVQSIEEEVHKYEMVSLYKDEKALYAVIDDKKAVGDLYQLELSALEKWWQTQEKLLTDIENYIKDVKKKIRQKKSRSIPGLLIVVLIVSLIGVGIAGFEHVFTKYLNAIAEITVPDVRNRTVQEAENELRELGLDPIVVAHVPSQFVPNHAVVSLFPEPGRIVKTGRKVKLKVSSGKAELKVPNLTGRPPEQVMVIMNRLNLELVIDNDNDDYSYTIARGRIITQNIAANSIVMEGDTVTVSISKGFPVKLSAQWEADSTENCTVKINCFLPDEWEETNIKVLSIIPPDTRDVILDEYIMPGGAINKNFIENYQAIIEVYYHNELAFKQSLKEILDEKENEEI